MARLLIAQSFAVPSSIPRSLETPRSSRSHCRNNLLFASCENVGNSLPLGRIDLKPVRRLYEDPATHVGTPVAFIGVLPSSSVSGQPVARLRATV